MKIFYVGLLIMISGLSAVLFYHALFLTINTGFSPLFLASLLISACVAAISCVRLCMLLSRRKKRRAKSECSCCGGQADDSGCDFCGDTI